MVQSCFSTLDAHQNIYAYRDMSTVLKKLRCITIYSMDPHNLWKVNFHFFTVILGL